MKTKKFTMTPLGTSIFEILSLLSGIFFVSNSVINMNPIIFSSIWLIIGPFLLEIFDSEEYSCVSRYRVVKKSGNAYFLQQKPFFPFFFLPWKGKYYSLVSCENNGYFRNAFETKKEALAMAESLKKRKDFKKIFTVKKLEIC